MSGSKSLEGFEAIDAFLRTLSVCKGIGENEMVRMVHNYFARERAAKDFLDSHQEKLPLGDQS